MYRYVYPGPEPHNTNTGCCSSGHDRVRAGLLFTVNHKVGFSKFQNLEKILKMNENSIARQNGSVKKIVPTNRTDLEKNQSTGNTKK